MPQWLNVVGLLTLSFALSRAALAALPAGRTRFRQLCGAHFLTLLLISSMAILLKGFDLDALGHYALAQGFWFIADMSRDFRPRKGRKFRNPLRSPQTGLALNVLVGLAGVLYLGLGTLDFLIDASGYRGIPPSGTAADVRYALSNPAYVRDAPNAPWRKETAISNARYWLYPDPQIQIRFNRTGGPIQDILCIQSRTAATGPCPATLGLSTGSTEADLVARLGSPTHVEVDPAGRKTMQYPEIGHDFLLEQFGITAIRIYDGNKDKLRKLGRLMVWLFP